MRKLYTFGMATKVKGEDDLDKGVEQFMVKKLIRSLENARGFGY